MSDINISDPSLAMSQAASQDLQAMQSRIQSLNGGYTEEERQAKMREACEGFEAIFIQNMWEQMRASLPQDGIMHSKEEQFWQGMYDEELAKSMAGSGGIGLADMMMQQMTRTDRSMSAASEDSARRAPMSIDPAPILPESLNQPAPLSQAAAGETAARQNTSIYEDSAWVQPEAPAAPDNIQGANVQAAGQDATTAQAANGAPSLVSQTLDDLAEMALSQQLQVLNQAQAELENMYAEIADAQAGLVQAPVDGNSAQPSSVQPGSVQPGSILTQVPPVVAQQAAQSAETELAAAEAAQPQVVNFTYQTNLPPNQRQASPTSSGASALYQPQVSESVNLSESAAPIQTALLTDSAVLQPAQPVQNAPSQALPAQDVSPTNILGNMDILAGISPRYIPSRVLAASTPPAFEGALMADASLGRANGAARPTYQNTIQAGGQRLRGPEPVNAEEIALGNPESSIGGLPAPVDGEISSGYGWRLDPFTGQRAWHTGVDIKAAYGENVRAAMDGTVVFAGEDPELGKLIIVEHADNLRTYYGHNSELNVSVGEQIYQGTNIAQAGSSGRAAGTHVHFEVRRGDLALNPEPLLAQGREYYTASAR